MNPHNKDEFAAAWAELDEPRAMEQALADDHRPLKAARSTAHLTGCISKWPASCRAAPWSPTPGCG